MELTIDAELTLPIATAQLLRFDLGGPRDDVFSRKDAYWVDLCITPRHRNARARYMDRWSEHRFERVGPLLMVPPGHAFQFRSDGGSQASIVCQLQPEAIRNWLQEDWDWSDQRLEAGLDISDPNVRNLLMRLAQELRHPGFAGAALTEMMIGQLAIELSRYSAAIGNSPNSGGLSPWRLRVIDERLADEAKTPTLTELATLCNISVRQLTRGFRASRGHSIGDHLAQSQIEGAKRRLASDESVKAIASAMGYATPSAFSYAFRRATGLTPNQFREAQRLS